MSTTSNTAGMSAMARDTAKDARDGILPLPSHVGA